MEFIIDKSKSDVIAQIRKDATNNKHLADGCKLSGEIKGDRITLFNVDDYNKNSVFLTQSFYGKVTEQQDGKCVIKGHFRLRNYVLILLAVLFAVAVESLVFGIVNSGVKDSIFSIICIIAIIVYIIFISRYAKKDNKIIEKYLTDL